MLIFMLVLPVLVLCRTGNAMGEYSLMGHSLHTNEWNYSNRNQMEQEAIQQQILDPLPGPAFNLKVLVNDALTRQPMGQALVEVYTNYTRTTTALTGEDGGVLIRVLYQDGTPMTIVASKDGYINTLMPCKSSRMPTVDDEINFRVIVLYALQTEVIIRKADEGFPSEIFSTVIMSLRALTQGNVWLFKDSVHISGKTSDASRPTMQFPKSLLNLTDGRDVASIKVYLSVSEPPSDEDSSPNTLGIAGSQSGYVSVELRPVAALSVQIFSGDTELDVRGPIKISLRIPDRCGFPTSSVVPAWFLNRTTGGWMRKGLGTVVRVDGKLIWTFTAPHLGYWIAAPPSSTRGFFGLDILLDFTLQHSSLLVVVLGGLLLIIICLLAGLLCSVRHSVGETKTKKMPSAMKRDQTTSTYDHEVSTGGSPPSQAGMKQSFTEKGDNQHNASIILRHNGEVIANPSAVAISMECNELELNTGLNDLTCLHETKEQISLRGSLMDNLFFYNQPVAILHAPAFFCLEEQPEQFQKCKSATLTRAGAANCDTTDPLTKESITQTLPKGPTASQNQTEGTEDQLQVAEESKEGNSITTSRSPFSIPESMSVPGTLNIISGSRHSMPALVELSEIPLLQPPRAWFVSLEGKPAAEIHYAVSEQQRRRRPDESRETSLDSGVDMSELNQISGRRAVTLERKATFVKSTSNKKCAPPQ